MNVFEEVDVDSWPPELRLVDLEVIAKAGAFGVEDLHSLGNLWDAADELAIFGV